MIILFVALRSELGDEEFGDGVIVVETGVGKVNAAIGAMSALAKWGNGVRWVNWGTAGSGVIPGGSIVQCGEFRQADADWRPICPKGHTPFDSEPAVIRGSGSGVTCWTGDRWESDGPAGVWDCEAWAIAKVARRFGVPFWSWKWVSDSGDSEEWSEHGPKIGGINAILKREFGDLGYL